MDRAELERMDREGLVLRAQAAGVRRARLLTRPELIDELLRLDPVIDEASLKRTRGFFGLARDLLSRVVERGLHLPDAADRLRAAFVPPPQVPRPEPQAVPTVTLAEIYAAQGHKQRAIETLQRVLAAEPDHGAARALLEKLQASDYVAPPPPLPPEPEVDEIGAHLGAPAGESGADAEADAEAEAASSEPPTSEPVTPVIVRAPEPVEANVDAAPSASPEAPRASADDRAECVAIPLGGGRTYVWWRLGAEDAAPATFVVRALVLVPTWDGPRQRTVDVPCDPRAGELVLRDLPPRAIVRVAVGYLDGGAFTPVAHSPALEASSTGLVRWTLEGHQPVDPSEPDGAAIARAAEAAERAAP